MKPYQFAVLKKSLAFLLCALIACIMSCSYKENISSYLDSEHMAPPVDEPFAFEVVGHRGYGSTTPENTLAALRRSITEEVDFAEVDGRLTSDDSVEVDRFIADGVVTNKPLMWKDWAALILKERG